MSFRWEEDLRDSFESIASPSLWSTARRVGSVFTLRESTCSDGRADWVWAAVSCQWPSGLPSWVGALLQQPTCARILACLKSRCPRTEDYLIPRIGVSERTLRHSVRELLGAGLIEDQGYGRWVLGPNFAVPMIEICSFEFKLENWKRALYQATRYRTFSHRVYVVMPTAAVTRARDKISMFRSLNVGLIAHDPDGSSCRILPAPKRQPTSRHRFIGALGMLLDSGHQIPTKSLKDRSARAHSRR
jgi:hypothetical protein